MKVNKDVMSLGSSTLQQSQHFLVNNTNMAFMQTSKVPGNITATVCVLL
jgi:hypothetical protein